MAGRQDVYLILGTGLATDTPFDTPTINTWITILTYARATQLVVKLLPNINHCYSLTRLVNPCTSLTLSRLITKYWPTRVISTFNGCIIGCEDAR